MLRGLFIALASLFALFAFLLQLFTLIGQVSNRVFLRHLYLAHAQNAPQNQAYNMGLWNYCNTDMSGNVNSCDSPRPGYNWANTPGISQALPNQAGSKRIKSLFLALFALVFIGMGLSFFLWLISMPFSCFGRRGVSASLSGYSFINFLVTLASLILALVLALRGLHILRNADSNWNGYLGNSIWCLVGATAATLMSFLLNTLSGFCVRRRRDDARIDPAVGAKQPPPGDPYQPQPVTNEPYAGNQPYTGDTAGRNAVDPTVGPNPAGNPYQPQPVTNTPYNTSAVGNQPTTPNAYSSAGYNNPNAV
ncbi:SUR7/PalI family-domain-containing protein [Radiomyces spectabilis]|uniref:SUR7/PalI family-domain-containing protein n=1 Tax=Radiomyces spectabilis TaxID=64574 RepID=UPI0022209D45|nr:SUR7/PalI family-domain-containing protein [Radiomyces spectabilis]KAI8381409.1 SUR7/PalI family-domain-containing protein [Radiomyces spectabilis]